MSAITDWYSMPELSGRLVRLEPLSPHHDAGYLAAAGTGAVAEDTFRWTATPGTASGALRSIDDANLDISIALAARTARERLAYVQLDARTGEVAGTTSFYEIKPTLRTLAIGYTWLGSRWQRSGLNTESKLLMLTHAFDTLGAVRVVWHTDINNVRSQAAIARLGAVREGELRKHKVRRDGSWRTTVQFSMTDDDWPTAKARLRQLLDRR